MTPLISKNWYDIDELADSGYQGMFVKRKGSDDNGGLGEFWFVNRGTEADILDPEDLIKDLFIADLDLALPLLVQPCMPQATQWADT